MGNQKVFIISGEQGEGKTTRLKEVLTLLQKGGSGIGGFVAEGFWEDNKRTAFTLVNARSGESIPLCSIVAGEFSLQAGRFFFNPDAITKGEKWLMDSEHSGADYVVLDEIGIFELEGKIWHRVFQYLVKHSNCPLIITVRNSALKRLVEKYRLEDVEIFSVDIPAAAIVEKLGKPDNKAF
jgi:nucleoside-triphosphatase